VKLERIMTPRPLVVTQDTSPSELESLVRAARVNHLPLVDDSGVAGVWVRRDDTLVLLGPEAVLSVSPDADAEEAIGAIVAGREAVVAVREGRPVGMLTRADVIAILREALAHGHGTRHQGPVDPVVVVLTGPEGAGRTTLLRRTIPFLRRCETGIVRADAPEGSAASRTETEGLPTVVDPAAAFRRGLHEAVRSLGDVQVVLVEDRPRPAGERGVPGGDTQVLVVPAASAGALTASELRDTQAVVVTRLDEAPDGFDLEALRGSLGRALVDLPVFGVGEDDGPGLAEWGEWVLGRVLARSHR
jgi:Ni2+-binding GTPase involved in maturation of urease and hydrogenase